MHKKFAPRKHVLAVSIASLFASGAAFAQAAPAADQNAATVVVTGTRVPNRTVLDTAVPVDVISAESLKNAGTTEITQALSVALPSSISPVPA
jgi:iron complex outermembrane receptor protein